MTTTYPSELTASYDSIKLGIDAHAQYYWINRQVDGATPQPVQKMNYDELMLFVVKQQKLTGNVLTCYEAGAFGFHLHRRLEELGIKNYVVQPQDWDERGKGVKNDRLDAAALCQRLDRYERGNKKAFSPMRTPTVDKESTERVCPRSTPHVSLTNLMAGICFSLRFCNSRAQAAETEAKAKCYPLEALLAGAAIGTGVEIAMQMATGMTHEPKA
jgi:transposase